MRLFLSALRHIELEKFTIDDFELMPGVRITNNKQIIERLVDDVSFFLGPIESYHISEAPAILYFEFENDEPSKELTNLQNIELIFVWVNDLLKNSWIIKDNCVTCDTGYSFHFTENPEVSSTLLRYMHTGATGGIYVTKFTLSELKEWSNVNGKIENYLHSKGSGSFQFMLEKNFSRVGRSIQFIKQARESRNLAYKLSNYCSALETLFTTDSTELAHKLSERVAFFLDNKFEKLETYRVIKKAYTIRSKLTHGASIDKTTISLLPEIAKNVDDRLREVFINLVNNENSMALMDGSNSSIDEYFEQLIFK